MEIARIHFWGIDSIALFYVLAGISVSIFLIGVYFRISIWLAGIKRDRLDISTSGIINLLIDGLFGRRIFKGDLSAGLMHLFIMWGFIGLFAGTALLTIDYWLIRFLTGNMYLIYSFCLEILGIMLIAGLFIALIRRYIARVSRMDNRSQDFWILTLLSACVLTGFMVEGVRLAVNMPEWEIYSFAGVIFSSLISSKDKAEAIYPFVWWFHALISLSLIAYFPFSKLFHSLAAPVNIYLAPQPMPFLSIEDRLSEGPEFSFRDMINFSACTRCGRCNEVCPSASAMEPFSPLEFITQADGYTKLKFNPLGRIKWFHERFLRSISGAPEISPEQIWYCTTCRACLEVCPVYIGAYEPISEVRMTEIEEGSRMSPLLTRALETLYMFNNPWERSIKKRGEWPAGLTVPDITEGAKADICYFVGCTTSIDTRAQRLARALVKIMTHAGISFGTLGKQETCCGDIARRVGEQGLFEEQMKKTMALFSGYGITELVTSSPHCFNLFKNEYPAYQGIRASDEGAPLQVRHYTQLLEELMEKGLVMPVKPLNIAVTYHDPCYLGRYNGIYEAPRRIIRSIPGVRLVEMAHSGPDSLCCGGGGGRMWQELKDEKKLSEVRIREAADTGADVVVTACPYCLIMLEDALKTADLEDRLKVMDLNELLKESLGLGDDE
ncbi:MAG TPA: heterodisulfide reductase-related iron-sulfur binding cluster [Desulfatiglandales bacterium]|nr:heterodisulfide reductase-related iron-sulfur binding cluster [Desulfatiglandales bacterium]